MDERGTASPVLVLLLVAGVAALALAVELGRFAAATREVAFAADAGAEAGGARLDRAAAYGGEIRLDPTDAERVAARGARRARGRPDKTIQVAATTEEVCVTVSRTFDPGLLRAFGVGSWEVEATSCAAPRAG